MMCGNDSITKMRADWDKYVPKVLALEKGNSTRDYRSCASKGTANS